MVDMAAPWPHNFPIPPPLRANWLVSFSDLAAEWYKYVSQYTICTLTVRVNSTYIKHSISLNWSLDRPRTSTVLEHSYHFTDILHVNFKIWGLNLICIDLHGKLKIAMTSCPPSSGRKSDYFYYPYLNSSNYYGRSGRAWLVVEFFDPIVWGYWFKLCVRRTSFTQLQEVIGSNPVCEEEIFGPIVHCKRMLSCSNLIMGINGLFSLTV